MLAVDFDRFLERLGLVGSYLFAFGAFSSTAAAHLGLFLALLFAVLLSASVYGAAQDFPEWSNPRWSATENLVKLWLFLPVAWWVGGERRHMLWMLALALAGFVAGRLGHIDWAHPLSFLTRRDGLGFGAIPFGQYCATALLGLVLFLPTMLRSTRRREVQALLVLAWLSLAGAALQGVVGAQSRGVWLALLVVLPLGMFLRWRSVFAGRVLPAMAGAVVVVVLVFGTAWLINGDTIERRIAQEEEAVQAVLDGDLEQVGNGSIGTRVQMAAFGFQRWLERPLLGWGPGAGPELLRAQGGPHLSKYLDLHSLYIQLPLELGVLGAGLLGLAVVRILQLARYARRSGAMAADIYAVSVSALSLHLLGALSNFRLFNTDWRFYWILFVVLAVGNCLSRPAALRNQGAVDGCISAHHGAT